MTARSPLQLVTCSEVGQALSGVSSKAFCSCCFGASDAGLCQKRCLALFNSKLGWRVALT